jgi:hypothetical protein
MDLKKESMSVLQLDPLKDRMKDQRTAEPSATLMDPMKDPMKDQPLDQSWE